MDRTTLNTRLERIQNEISKLVNTLYALNLTDSDTYPQNYEELSTDAALRAEKIACTLRNLIYSANLVPKPILMQKAADIQGITVTQIDCQVVITLPGLMPKKKKGSNPAFITEPLYQCLADYAGTHPLRRFDQCVVCFSHQYDQNQSARRIRDYDNLECKQILDTVAAFLMKDDSGLLCDVYHCTQFGTEDCTILTIMEKSYFSNFIALIRAKWPALLGAAAMGDIGKLFPDSDERYRGADSLQLLREVCRKLRAAGYEIGNVDSTVVAQAPKLAPYIPQMRQNIAAAAEVEPEQVSVKATTEEQLGFTGSGDGVSAQAIALLQKNR